jgi:hypothetical protein
VVSLATVPPLLALTTVTRDQGTDQWTVLLQRMLPIRSPMQPAAVPLPPLDDPGAVKSQFGFCGASDLRAQITKTRAEIAKLAPDAEAATLLIASAPTFEGVRRRAERVSRTERDARAIMTQVIEGLVREKLPFKAVGYEEPAVLVELWGGPKELRKLETLLLAFGDRVKPTDGSPAGVVRRSIVVLQAKRDGPTEGQPTPGHDDHGH